MVDVVGPICESGDFLAKERILPQMIAGDLLAVRSVGAYGAAMSSFYNSRSIIPEVLVNGREYSIIRKAITVDHMLDFEIIPKWGD